MSDNTYNRPIGTITTTTTGMDERETLRNIVLEYKPGTYIKDLSPKQKLPPYLVIGLFGCIGAGKSALVNTFISACNAASPVVLAATQSLGKHGTLQASTYALTNTLKVVDTRGFEMFLDQEQNEVEKLLDGKIERNRRIYRKHDKEWKQVSFWTHFAYKLKNKWLKFEQEMHMAFLLIDLTTEYEIDLDKMVEVVKLIRDIGIRPLVVLTHKDLTTDPKEIQNAREMISKKLDFDTSHVVAIESYHFNSQNDPLDSPPRDENIERRALKLLEMSIQLGDAQIRELSSK